MIKMRVNKSKSSKCDECGTKYMSTLEMYDIMFIDTKHTICYDCSGKLFHKLLKADCLYNGRIKSNEDIARKNRYYENKNKVISANNISINEALKDE